MSYEWEDNTAPRQPLGVSLISLAIIYRDIRHLLRSFRLTASADNHLGRDSREIIERLGSFCPLQSSRRLMAVPSSHGLRRASRPRR